MSKDLINIFFREKPMMILVSLKNTKSDKIYASLISKEVDCTYSHVVKVLKELEKHELISFESDGRLKQIRLSDRGKLVAEYIEKLITVLNDE